MLGDGMGGELPRFHEIILRSAQEFFGNLGNMLRRNSSDQQLITRKKPTIVYNFRVAMYTVYVYANNNPGDVRSSDGTATLAPSSQGKANDLGHGHLHL